MKRNRRRLAFLMGIPILFLSTATILFSLQFRQCGLDYDLIRALKTQNTPLAIRLLEQGADANAVDTTDPPRGLRRLLEDWWDRNIKHQVSVEQGKFAPAITLVYPDTMPIFEEHLPENLPLLRALIEHGADPDAANYRGFTLLHKAAMVKHMATVQFLLEHGANPNASNDEGYVPLYWSNAEIATHLLKHGADVNHRNVYGDVPLTGAIIRRDMPRVCVLLAAHANVNEQNNRGLTPFHFLLLRASTESGYATSNRELANALLQHGAKVDIKDKSGKTVLDHARKDKVRDLIPLLVEAARVQHKDRMPK